MENEKEFWRSFENLWEKWSWTYGKKMIWVRGKSFQVYFTLWFLWPKWSHSLWEMKSPGIPESPNPIFRLWNRIPWSPPPNRNPQILLFLTVFLDLITLRKSQISFFVFLRRYGIPKSPCQIPKSPCQFTLSNPPVKPYIPSEAIILDVYVDDSFCFFDGNEPELTSPRSEDVFWVVFDCSGTIWGHFWKSSKPLENT